MATTTGGTTYVTSTDLVADYPTASLALANRVDVVASGGPGLVKTAGYTITVADILGGNKFLYNSASPGTFTLPTSSLVDGMVVNVAQIGAGALTVSGGTIVGTTVTTAQYQGLSFVYVAAGTTWYSVAPSVATPGLSIVSPTSIANSGGSASASGGEVTCSGVTSLSLNGIFTSTYSNYSIVFTHTETAGAAFNMRMRASGSDNSTSNYAWGGGYQAYGSAATAEGATGTNTWQFSGQANGTNSVTINVYLPQAAFPTTFNSSGSDTGNVRRYGGYFSASTQFDGISFYGGTFSGTVRVYGYKNS
jgi:hypothetical protein